MSDKKCHTCPNCGKATEANQFEDHVRKCPRKGDRDFPKYLMIMGVLDRGADEKFVTMGEAGPIFDSGFMKVEIGPQVLEADFSLRPIAKAEEALISQLADDYSESK